MSKYLITAADIREAARTGRTSISVPSQDCIITPMAVDEANALNISLEEKPEETPSAGDCPNSTTAMQPDDLTQKAVRLLQAKGLSDMPATEIEKVVKEVVAARIGKNACPSQQSSAQPAAGNSQGVRLIDCKRLLAESNKLVPVAEKMLIATAVGGEAGERLTGGYMVWENATFHRRLDVPEIAVVIEGELHLAIDGDTLVAGPGDMIYFPKGATVEYHAPAAVKLACVNCV